MRLTENTKIRIKVPKSLYEAIQAELDMKQGMEDAVTAEELKKCYKYYLNGFFDKVKKLVDAEVEAGTDPDSAIAHAIYDLGMEMMETKKEGYMGTQYDSSEDMAVDMLKKGLPEKKIKAKI